LDAGFLGDFADGGVLEGFAGVLAAAGEFPPVVVGLVGVAGVDEQDAIVPIEQKNAGADAWCVDLGCRWHPALSSGVAGRCLSVRPGEPGSEQGGRAGRFDGVGR
jgi:hypothetical protein